MKRIIILSILALQICVGCQKEIKNESENGDRRIYKSITANITETSKTLLDLAEKKITWCEGDQIMVQDRNNLSNQVTFTLDPSYNGLSTGIFRIYDNSGKVDENNSITGEEFNIFYLNKREQPIQNWEQEGTVSILSNQNYIEGGIEDNIIPMTAFSTTLSNVTLNSQASVLSINLINNEAETKVLQSIELSSDDYLSGNLFIDIKNNTRERATSEYESWTSGDNPMLNQKKSITLSLGKGLSLASGETKRINIAVGRNRYNSLKYTITYKEGEETKKCILSSSKRIINTKGGETILLGTQEITQSFENLYFTVNGVNYSENDFKRLSLSDGDRVAIRSNRIENSTEVLTQAETGAALKHIESKKRRVSIDFSNVKAGYSTINSNIFSSVKNYIQDLYFPKDVVTITTFKGLGTMGNVYLNEGLEVINGGGAGFYNQTMEKVYIPASVKSIGTANFEHASGIVVDEANSNYWSDGVSLFTLRVVDGEKKPYMLSSICGRVDLSSTEGVYEIPESVVGHLQYAQDYATNIKTLVIPKGFYSIASAHLRYCTNLSCLRFKNPKSLFAWARNSGVQNGAIEIILPDDCTDAEVNASINSYYGNYKTWVQDGWVIRALTESGDILKTLTSGNIDELIIVNEDEDLF